MKQRVLVATALAALALPAAALATTSTTGRSFQRAATVNWQIALAPGATYAHAAGSAQYQSQPGQSEFQAEVEHIASLAGTRVVFKVDGVTIGKRLVSARGRAQIGRNTELGQPVPSIARGSVVTVLDQAGATIASGTF